MRKSASALIHDAPLDPAGSKQPPFRAHGFGQRCDRGGTVGGSISTPGAHTSDASRTGNDSPKNPGNNSGRPDPAKHPLPAPRASREGAEPVPRHNVNAMVVARRTAI